MKYIVEGLEDIETFEQLLEEGVAQTINSARRLGFTQSQFLAMLRTAWYVDFKREWYKKEELK